MDILKYLFLCFLLCRTETAMSKEKKNFFSFSLSWKFLEAVRLCNTQRWNGSEYGKCVGRSRRLYL